MKWGEGAHNTPPADVLDVSRVTHHAVCNSEFRPIRSSSRAADRKLLQKCNVCYNKYFKDVSRDLTYL